MLIFIIYSVLNIDNYCIVANYTKCLKIIWDSTDLNVYFSVQAELYLLHLGAVTLD